MHQTQSYRYLIGFSYEKAAGRRYRQCFLLDKSCRKMYTIFSAVLRQQRKSDVITSFGLTACSAVYYQAGSPLRLRQTTMMTIVERRLATPTWCLDARISLSLLIPSLVITWSLLIELFMCNSRPRTNSNVSSSTAAHGIMIMWCMCCMNEHKIRYILFDDAQESFGEL
jgi:hypothetical protein